MAIDGSKYYYWRTKFIQTGSLKAFDLMTRHYAADQDNLAEVKVPAPVGRRHRNDKGLFTISVPIFKEEWPNTVTPSTRNPTFVYCERKY